jgi:ribosomal protein L21E
LVGCDVIVTGGLCLGSVGTVIGKQGYGLIVKFTVDNVAREVVFEERELATLEPLK